MDKAVLERRLHLTVTFIGGFMGCYAIFNRCDVFGSAQTGNLISFVMGLTGHSDPHMFFRFSALLIYILAMVATVFLSHKLQKTTLKLVSILIDAMAFLLLGFLPEDMDPFIALYPVFFATAFQWCSFKGADGFNSSCIFCTNNLRQCTTGFAEYHLYSSMKTVFFPERKRQKKKRFSGFMPENLLFVICRHSSFVYAAGSSVSSTDDSMI